VTTLDRLSSMRGSTSVGSCRAGSSGLLRGHELVNACRVRLGGFERVGVLEGLRQCFIGMSDARPCRVHTAIDRVVSLSEWRQLFSFGTAAPQPMPLDCWPVGPSASAWTRSGGTRRL